MLQMDGNEWVGVMYLRQCGVCVCVLGPQAATREQENKRTRDGVWGWGGWRINDTTEDYNYQEGFREL